MANTNPGPWNQYSTPTAEGNDGPWKRYTSGSVEPPKRTIGAALNDTVIEIANAAAGGVSSAANFVKPGNAASKWIDENIVKAGEEKQSDVVKAEKQRLSADLASAEGVGDEVAAVGRYIANNPVLSAAQAAGSFAGPGLAVKGATTGARVAGAGAKAMERAGRAGGVAAGAAMAGGDAAGTAYELASKAGATEDQAVAAGRQASVLPAIVGGAGGAFGAEKLLAGAKGFTGGTVARALKTGASEALQEGVEEGVTQYEGQRAAVPYDPSIDPSKGVAGAAAMGAALGGITGAGMGALDGIRHGGQQGADPLSQTVSGQQAAEAAAADAQAKAEAAAPSWTTAPGVADPNAPIDTAPAVDANAPRVAEVDFETQPGAAPIRENTVDFTREFDTGGLALDDGKAPGLGYNPLAGTPTVFPDGSVALNGEQEFQHRTGVDPARAQIEQAASAGGALSSAALAALDTGASGALQQQAASTQTQQAQAQERASAEKASAAQAKGDEKAARAGQSRIDMKTGDLLEPASVSNLTGQQLTETYRAARKPETRRILEQEMSRRDQQALQAELDAEQAGTVPGAERADAAFASVTEDAQADVPATAPQLSAREQAGLASSIAGRELVAQPLSPEMAGLQSQLAQVQQRAADNGSWNVPLMGQRRRIEAAIAKLQTAEKQTTQGVTDATQADQAQQGSAQPPQVGAAPAVARGAPDAQGRSGADGAQQAAAAGLTDGAPTANPGTQAAAAPGAQVAPQAEGSAQRVARTGEAWTRMPTVERQALAQRADLKPIVRKNVHRAAWADLNRDVQRKLAEAMEPVQETRPDQPVQAAADYEAQVVEMLDPASPRTSVTIAAGDEIPESVLRAQTNRRTEPGFTMKPVKGGAVVLTSSSKSPAGEAAIATAPPIDLQDSEQKKSGTSAEKAQGAAKTVAKARAKEDAAAAPPAVKKSAPRDVLAKKAANEEAARADFFAPGNIVKSYDGHDRVVAYTPPDADGRWSVTVRAVEKQGDAWVEKAGAPERVHGTQPDARELKAGPVGRVQAPEQTQRFEVGKALSKEERKAVLSSLVDVYKAKGAPRELKGVGRDGNERTGYVHSPELFEKSDITGAMVRYYVTLPDGRRAHPTELFPEYTQADIDAELELQRAQDRAKASEVQRLTEGRLQFDSREDAEAYWDDRSAKSLRTASGLPTIFSSLDRTLLTDGQKFVLVPDSSIKQPGMAEAFADAGWSQPDRSAFPAAESPKNAPASETVAQAQAPELPPVEASAPTDRITDFGEKIGGARKDQAGTKGAKVARPRSTDERPAWARRYEVSQIAKSNRVGEEGRWVVRDSRRLDAFKQPRQMGRETYATKEDAEQAVPLLAVSQKHRVVPVRGDGEGYEIWRDISDRKRVKVVDQVFPTREAALEYMVGNAQAIIETNTTFGESDLPRPPSDQRIGVERRAGDARDSDFMEVFGFRGVEFGNWNNQHERRELLNDAYDGLLDLAEVMDVPPRAISLNGELALAFGARGHGLSGARAHYELDKVVINLTKMNGAGSLAHEWFHALDHYFGRQDGKAPAEWVVAKDGTRSLRVHDAPEDDMASGGTRGERSGMRPELREAFADVMRTIARKAEAYVEDTARADRFVAAAREEVKRRLDGIRADLARDLDSRYYKRHNKAATAEQLAEFDSVAEKIVAGELLELRVESKGSGRSITSGVRWTNDALNRLSTVMKAVRGRQGFTADQDGPLDRLRGLMQNYSARLKMLADAQGSTEKSQAVPTEFVMNAKELDQGRGQDYWTRPHELAARAFQGYVEDKIAERGGRSPFLNYGPENAAIPTPWGFKRPFPAGAERVAINKSLDKLVDVIQTREGENGDVALFRREGAEGSERATEFEVDSFLKAMGRPSAYSEAGQRQAIDSVSATADAIRAAWGPNAPEVVVAFDMQDERIPEAARKADLRQRSGGARGAPEGFYYRGKAYLMASRLNTPNDAARVLYHEVLGHHGLRGKFGRDLDQVLNQIATMRKAEVAAKMKEYGLRGVNSLSVREAAEEVLAEMAEKTPQLPFVQRAISAIRNFLRTHVPGFQSLRLTDSDIIQAYILPARGWVERGGPGGPGGGVSFSRDAGRMEADALRLLAAAARSSGNENTTLVLGPVTDDALAMLQREGVPVEVGYRHTADMYAVRHALSRHGDAQVEAKQGQLPLSDADIAAIPEAIAAPDAWILGAKTPRGQDIVGNLKRLPDGTVLYLEEVRSGRKALAMTSMRKYPGTTDFETIRNRIVPSYAQSDTGDVRIVYPAGAAGQGEVLFSRSSMADLKDSALQQIHQTLDHPGKVSLWDKTVGTMRNLAERSPVFKPVYEAAQRFIDDVSMLGNDAADRAPRLLPRVETLADLKKKPITAADNQAVAKPLFEGTLLWARDVDGKPVTTEALNAKYRNTTPDEKAQILLRTGKIQEQMLKVWRGLPVDQYNTIINNKFDSTILKPGVVWTAKELKDLFDLSAQQVSLYQEARAAIDRSIDMTARADMLRALGAGYAGLREAVLAQASVEDAMVLITDTLQAEAREQPDQADRILSLNNAVVKSYERAQALMEAGYAPLSRFGRYTVDVVGKDGTREYFGMFESMYESNKMKAAMEKEFPGATVTQGTMSDEAFKLFQGITPESLEHFGEMLGLSGDGSDPKDKAFQAYLQLAKNNHSALKRLIHRKGISGYSEDVGRVLASFVYSNARLAAGGLNAGTLETAIEGIPKEQGELRDVAMGLRSYIQDPQEEGQAVRGMLFAQYLGGSVASAMVNMTQPFQITMPWLSQFGGMRSAASHLAAAVRDMTRRSSYEPDLAKALQTAEAEGIVSPQEIHQLMAQARGAGSLRTGDGTKLGDARAAAANNWERVKVAWGQPFALAEQFNRRSTFIAAYRIAKEQGMADPAKFAERAVQETQFVYSKANKPKWARGAIGGTLFTFKTYSVSYLELMHRMWSQGGPEGKRAVGWAVAMLLLMGGAGGLPFMEDAEDLIDGAGQLMGYNISTKHWRKQALRDVVGKELADFMEQGVSGLPGAPIDVSGRLGMGNLIPGTGLLLAKQNRERDLLEVAGPAGDLVARGFTGARKLLTGDVVGAALEVSPTAARNWAKGIDMGTSGIYKDAKGYKVIDTTLEEAIAKFAGFQPKSVAEVQEANSFMQRSKSFYIQTSNDIKAQWAQAVFEKDDAALQRVRDRLAAWNRNNPDQPIVVKIPDVMKRVREMGKDRTQRIADTAPKALRDQMRSMAKENG